MEGAEGWGEVLCSVCDARDSRARVTLFDMIESSSMGDEAMPHTYSHKKTYTHTHTHNPFLSVVCPCTHQVTEFWRLHTQTNTLHPHTYTHWCTHIQTTPACLQTSILHIPLPDVNITQTHTDTHSIMGDNVHVHTCLTSLHAVPPHKKTQHKTYHTIYSTLTLSVRGCAS